MGRFQEKLKKQEQKENATKKSGQALKEEGRKRETRRLIFLGRWVENKMNSGRISKADVYNDMDQWLTRDWDRELFELPPLEEPQPSSKKLASSKKKPDAAPGAAIVAATSREDAPSTEAQPAPVATNGHVTDMDDTQTTRGKGILQESGVSLAEFNL